MDVKVLLEEYIEHPSERGYECLTRKLAEVLNGKHYTEDHAKMEVSRLHYTDANGVKHTGAKWTCEEIEAATKDKAFPEGTTKWDRFVAYNVTASDLGKKFTDAQILDAAYLFWFADEDWSGEGKIWDYMSL